MKNLILATVLLLFSCGSEFELPSQIKINEEKESVSEVNSKNKSAYQANRDTTEIFHGGTLSEIEPKAISIEEKYLISQEKLNKIKPKKQVFEIKNPQNGIIVQGEKGTVIEIPETIASRIPFGAKTTLELYEYYGVGDLISSSISTAMEDGSPLQTAGSVHIDLKVDGESFKLDPFDSYDISFPAEEMKNEFSLFFTNNTPNLNPQTKQTRTITWVDYPTININFSPYIIATKCFNFSQADFYFNYFGLKCTLDEYILRYFNDNPLFTNDEEELLNTRLNVSYGVNYLGKVENISVEGAVDDSVKRSIETFLKSLEFDIIKLNKNGGIRRMTHQFGFTKKRQDLDPMECIFTAPGISKTRKIKIETNPIYGTREVAYNRPVQTYKSSSFGFINCDRYLRYPGRKLTIKVRNPEKYSDYYLVYTKDKCVLPGNKMGDLVYFNNVPEEKEVLLIKIIPSEDGFLLYKKFGTACQYEDVVDMVQNNKAKIIDKAALQDLDRLF
jgi:hypothetical protein